MTLFKVIDKYIAYNPDVAYTPEQLTDMLNTLERTIQTELLHTFPYVTTRDANTGKITKNKGTIVSYNWDTDQNAELLLTDTPFDDLYGLYLTAMVAFYRSEWSKYDNAQSVFNARYMNAMQYYSRMTTKLQENRINNFW